jgi:HlyD family secretion protein
VTELVLESTIKESSLPSGLPSKARGRIKTALKVLPLVLFASAIIYQRFLSPVPVSHETVSSGPVAREAFGRGTVESRREAQLGFDMAGRISDLLVDEGDRVTLGQVLGHLEPEQYRAEVRTAFSGAALARAALSRLDAEERRARATLVFAVTEEQRARQLAKAGTMTRRDLDLAVQQLALAQAELSRVQAVRTEARRSIDVASGSVDLHRAVAMRTALVSPFDGLVIRRFHDPGDPVAVGATVLRVVATDHLWVRAWIDETALDRLAEGQKADIRFPGDPARAWPGTVDRIGREADRQTHELLVDVAMKSFPRRIAIGQRADVWIEIARHPEVLRLRPRFLHREDGAVFALVARRGRIARIPLVLGLAGKEWVEVTGGLTAGDVVLDALKPGETLPEGRRWKAVDPT